MSIFRCMVLTAFSFVFAGQLFAQNLITNGGFESGGTGWNLQLQTNFLGTVTYPTTGAPEGTTYAHVNITQAPGTNPDSINWMAQLQFPQWTAVKNAIYTLSFKAKSSATTMKVGLNRGAPSYAYVNGFAFTLTTSWQTYSCMFTDTASGNGALLLNFNVGAAVGTYDFDSVNLVQTGTNVPTNSLISNGGFETAGSGWGLYVQSGTGAAATVSYPSTGAAEGTMYGSVNVSAIATVNTSAIQVQLQLPLFTADSNAWYILSYKARGPGDIVVASQDGATYATVQQIPQTLTSAWAPYADTFSCNVKGSGALRLNFWLGLSTGTYDFDAVSVVKTTSVMVKNASSAFVPGKLTVRKMENRLEVSAPGRNSNGRFSIGVYTAQGRMVKSISGLRESAAKIFIPMSGIKGTCIVRFTDASGTVADKFCWVR
ncbi:MAG: carbohydrate binding domain-containing protein [Chitinivibrionales bacterium]